MNPVCCGCCHEMQCKKTGVIIEINQWHYYSGDKYYCKRCDRSVIVNMGQAFTSPPLPLLDATQEVIKLEQ